MPHRCVGRRAHTRGRQRDRRGCDYRADGGQLMPRNDQLSEQARTLAPFLLPWLLRDLYVVSTWTVTYVGGTTAGVTTYSLQDGKYIRIGSLVIFTGAVVWTAATGTGDARISLPF